MHEDEINAGRGTGWIDPKTGRVAVVHGFRSTFRDWYNEMKKFIIVTLKMPQKLRFPTEWEVPSNMEAPFRGRSSKEGMHKGLPFPIPR